MKKRPKDRKARATDAKKAKQAEFDRAMIQPVRTWSARMPAHTFNGLRPVPELRELPEGVIQYYETVLHRQRAQRL